MLTTQTQHHLHHYLPLHLTLNHTHNLLQQLLLVELLQLDDDPNYEWVAGTAQAFYGSKSSSNDLTETTENKDTDLTFSGFDSSANAPLLIVSPKTKISGPGSFTFTVALTLNGVSSGLSKRAEKTYYLKATVTVGSQNEGPGTTTITTTTCHNAVCTGFFRFHHFSSFRYNFHHYHMY
ncbi:unnamed protein product [Ambrosiozyma monospora]|uniref:Unnamed protein product n=1 Tax=Ambrosiozyma monospora TaxID=43982 RepID=A0ACB5UCF7_AMBMO|nr:unnamed protein product [Ambrosiozyma monospora]